MKGFLIAYSSRQESKGTTLKPVKDMNAAYNCIDMGVPFTRPPKNLVLDYAAFVGNKGKVILFISLGTQGAYKGEQGNWLKIDNVGLECKETHK